MNKRRIGNDFFVTWEIKDQGELVDLIAVKDSIELYCNVDKHSFKVPKELIEVLPNGLIRVEIKTEVFKYIGRNEFTLKYKHFDLSMSDNDRKREYDFAPFFLVAKSALADKNVDIAGTSDLLLGLKGDSAFDIWNNNNGGNNTYQDWIDFLQAPATAIEGIVSANETVRISNENTRISNEQSRVSNESSRVASEFDREENEDTRSVNEATRLTNEEDRIASENQRVLDETKRETLYDEVVILKGETETARDGAITATNQINDVVIPNAELATQNAQNASDDYNNVVKPDVIAKANYAQEQGNYAKAQGEAVDGRITDIESKIGYNIGWYGIQFDETIANSACTRIGEMALHRLLPIQSRMRRCLLLDNGKVNYYLHRDDSTKKENGSNAILDGTDGQVMVEIPAHWRRFEKDGTVHRVKISDFKLEGFHFVPKAYRSAFEATVERSTNKLSSVMNMNADYRGGNNNATWDGKFNSLLGRAASSISGTNFASYAKNRGGRWCMDVYHVKKTMDWLYYIEFANFNSQLGYNPLLTPDGFKQGGLGIGVTNMSDWANFGSYPFVPIGVTNIHGNKTCAVDFLSVKDDDALITQTLSVPSYRGIEHPFGHVWKWTDGIKINIQADDAGGQSQLYVCEDPLKFQHSNYVGYDMRGLLPRANGYVSAMLMGEYGELMPRVADGGSTTYFADYFYTSIPSAGESQRGVLFGGSANDGASPGLASAYTNSAFTIAHTPFGSRLCFIP